MARDELVAQSRADPVRVLYIGGAGRSGSTLLDVMLGQLPGFASVGELRFIWKRGLTANQLCGCGAHFRECPFWSAVGTEAFGGWDAIDAAEMVALEETVDRHRFLPFILAPSMSRPFRARLSRYVDVLSQLYRGIHAVSGCSYIVDSTKDPPYAFLLNKVNGVDVRLVHLVRDSRGVAFSWTKRVRRPELRDSVVYMNRYHPLEMGVRWLAYNSLFHLLERLGVPRILVRYEQLVRSPRTELERILEHLEAGLSDDAFGFIRDGSVELGVHHTVAGNPMRFSRGQIALNVDDEWTRELDPVQRRLLSVVTWPLLQHYGYPARSRR